MHIDSNLSTTFHLSTDHLTTTIQRIQWIRLLLYLLIQEDINHSVQTGLFVGTAGILITFGVIVRRPDSIINLSGIIDSMGGAIGRIVGVLVEDMVVPEAVECLEAVVCLGVDQHSFSIRELETGRFVM